MGNMFAQDHKNFPQLMFIATETSTNVDFGHRKNSWLELDLDYVIGHYYWTATDYIGEAGEYPQKVWGRSFFDITDEITSIGYLYKQYYSKKPMVHILIKRKKGALKERFDNLKNKRWDWYPTTENWNWKRNEKVTVQVMSNAEEVELFLNGKSLGKKKYTGKHQDHLAWEVKYKSGKLKAIARNKGEKVAEHILSTTGKPVELKLTSDVNSIKSDGLDIAYIKVELVDENGTIVRNSDERINFTVKGGAYNAGVGNADIFTNERWVSDSKSTFEGKCLLIVRSNRKKENVTIKASVKGLPSKTMVVKVE